VDPDFIDPGSPWQNGTCESFNGRFRDELLVCEQFNMLLEVHRSRQWTGASSKHVSTLTR
jgi:transposase InsO family protein